MVENDWTWNYDMSGSSRSISEGIMECLLQKKHIWGNYGMSGSSTSISEGIKECMVPVQAYLRELGNVWFQ